MKKRKLLVILAIWLLVIGGTFLFVRFDEMQNVRKIQMVQNAKISDGVTILEGIEAYVGEKGSWSHIGDNTIHVEAYNSDMEKSIYAEFQINKRTNSADIITFLINHYEPRDEQDLKMCLQELVQAALGKR